MGQTLPKEIVADSSFYICFLEDIQQPHELIRFLKCFIFIITPIVYDEVSKCKDFQQVESVCNLTKHSPVGEILKPFFSKSQVEKGETEVIELAYEFYAEGSPIHFILDDGQARGFVKNNLTDLTSFMMGTVGFVGKCCYEFFLIGKDEATKLVIIIGASKFRVHQDVISEVLTKIQQR